MSNHIIGRDEEIKVLQSFLTSKKAEFLAIYGRRRIGKTFLIRQFFQGKNIAFFNSTGEKDAPMKTQIAHFTKQISATFYSGIKLEKCKNWDETFELLTKTFQTVEKHKKIVLFFDEFPWMAGQNARLLQSLDYYWNHYWSNDPRIKLIICGSSASWIIDNIVNNEGGLHNRLTQKIALEPFNLSQTADFLKDKGISLSKKHIVDLYMCMGGIPYYLSKIEKGISATQIIESLAFTKQGFLLEEFDNLFSSLFKNSELYIDIIKTIAVHRYGVIQNELLERVGKNLVGKGGVDKLKALKDTGFIMDFISLFHIEKGRYYKLIDNYSLFYLYWIEPVKNTLLKKSLVNGYWDKIKTKSEWHSWSGLAFEAICYEHLPEITKALELSPTSVPGTWRYVSKKNSDEKGAQIDLLFDRDDDAITICEIKYSDKPFVITKEYAMKLEQKLEIFKKITRTSKQLFLVFISANGIKSNQYSEKLVTKVITIDDLFQKIK